MIGGEHGRGRGSKDDDTELGQETQLQYDAFNVFDYRDAAPSPLSPYSSSPLEAPAPLQHNVEDDVPDGGNAPVGAIYKGQGPQLRAERSSLLFFVMLLLVVVNVLVDT